MLLNIPKVLKYVIELILEFETQHAKFKIQSLSKPTFDMSKMSRKSSLAERFAHSLEYHEMAVVLCV